jgi:hypothetical protein
MKIKIEYVDGAIQDLIGTYDVYDNYINVRCDSDEGDDYSWYDVVIPLNSILCLIAHV